MCFMRSDKYFPWRLIRPGLKAIVVCSLLLSGITCCVGQSPAREASGASGQRKSTPVPWEIVGEIPLPASSFTQGLYVEGDTLWLGTGQYGQSRLYKLHLEDGEIQQSVRLPNQFFGEGVTVIDGRAIQLTWQSGYVFTYDKETLKQTGYYRIKGEGWGLTHDGKRLILSSGLPSLQIIDPLSFQVVRKLDVSHNSIPVGSLNELEFVKGWILANVWTTNKVLFISPVTGEVCAYFDFTDLAERARRADPEVDVLNGIAWDEQRGELLITGKLYTSIYRVRVKDWPELP